MSSEGTNIIRDKSKAFAIRIVKMYTYLRDEHKEFVMSKQLLRSGTSIGANIAEGYYGESPSDFVHKYAIAQKECNETIFWIELLHDTGFITDEQFESINSDCVELIKLLTASIKTVKTRAAEINR